MVKPAISLRPTEPSDLSTLFQLQLDPASNLMAGTKPFSDEIFRARWASIFKDAAVVPRVIILEGRVVGSISCFQNEGTDHVGYWIAKDHWGKGIAGQALALLLKHVTRRPLRATAATSNAASIRALERNGFRQTRVFAGDETDRYLPREVAEFILD